MKMMMIEWVGEDREVPGYGLLSSGDVKGLPEDMGEDFIRQGLAVNYSFPEDKGE